MQGSQKLCTKGGPTFRMFRTFCTSFRACELPPGAPQLVGNVLQKSVRCRWEYRRSIPRLCSICEVLDHPVCAFAQCSRGPWV